MYNDVCGLVESFKRNILTIIILMSIKFVYRE